MATICKVERVGLNSPAGIIVSCGRAREVVHLPLPRECIADPLEPRQQAGLIRWPTPGPTEFAKVRKVDLGVQHLKKIGVDLELRGFRWWGNWFEDTEIEEDNSETEVDRSSWGKQWTPEQEIVKASPDYSDWSGNPCAHKHAPLRILEIRIGEQVWWAIEVPQIENGLKRATKSRYEPWVGDRWTPKLASAEADRIVPKIAEYICDDCA